MGSDTMANEDTDQVGVAEVIRSRVEDEGFSVGAYSGRGMFGRECVSVDVGQDDHMSHEDLIAAVGVQGAKVDSLGRGVVVYWPRVTWPSEWEEDG
jgi:hypothetical protein